MSSRPRNTGGRPKRNSSPRPGSGGSRSGGPSNVRPAILVDGEKGTRLQKFLASAGVESRRNCEEFIRDGRVTIDSKIVTNPAVSVFPERQDVRLDGERLRQPRYRYYLLNKPKGVVCTNQDPAGRPRAVDLVPCEDQRLFTVGRLDENTLGLLLITNDGALAEHLAHPRYEVVRRYRVQVAGIPEAETLTELKKGMYFSEGYFRFHDVRLLKRRGRSTFLELELREGKNREIRRMLARAGHKVLQLERVAFGPLRIGQLDVGQCRELRAQEVRDLYKFIETAPAVRNASTGGRSPASSAKSRTRPPTKKRSRPAQKERSEATSVGKRGAARKGIPKKAVSKRSATGRSASGGKGRSRGK